MCKHHNPPRDGPWLSKLIAVLCAVLFLSACKTFSPDGGMDLVAGISATELRKDVAVIRHRDEAASGVRERVEDLLRRPLSADQPDMTRLSRISVQLGGHVWGR